MHSEALTECNWRYTCRPCWSELRDALQDRNRPSVVIHLEAIIMRTWRPWSCESGGRNRARFTINLEAVFGQVCKYPRSPWSLNLGCYDHTNWETVIVTGVLDPNNQYNIYWTKYNRLSICSFSPCFFLKLNLLSASDKSFQIEPSPMPVPYVYLN